MDLARVLTVACGKLLHFFVFASMPYHIASGRFLIPENATQSLIFLGVGQVFELPRLGSDILLLYCNPEAALWLVFPALGGWWAVSLGEIGGFI